MIIRYSIIMHFKNDHHERNIENFMTKIFNNNIHDAILILE
jgi:hypothetical protein